jgi:nucleotide-binding universal stress UspA family protein
VTTLLLAYDGSDNAADAVRAAARLFPGASAVVLCVRGDSVLALHGAVARIALPDSVLAAAAEEQERAADERAESVAARGVALASEAGLDARPQIAAGSSAWRPVASAAEAVGADVIVCGSRGTGPVSRAVLGSTSTSLLHHAGCPLLVVPAGAGVSDGPALIGYDGSAGARAVLPAAGSLLAGREAVVVHTWQSRLQASYASMGLDVTPVAQASDLGLELEREVAAIADDVAAEGASLAREAGLTARALAVREDGGPWRSLAAAAAAEGAAVLVVGSRGQGALRSSVLGSVSAGLAHNAELPVLVVRAGG